jgi:hypothetical protein
MLAASEATNPGSLPVDSAMPGQPAIETVERPLQGYKPSLAELTAARQDPTPKAMMELVEKMTLKDINDNLLKTTGKSFSGVMKRNSAPMLAILMYQDVVPMPKDGASDELQRSAQEQAEATQDQATEAAESIFGRHTKMRRLSKRRPRRVLSSRRSRYWRRGRRTSRQRRNASRQRLSKRWLRRMRRSASHSWNARSR